VAVKTLEYLDSSFQVDNLQKSMFFKSLPQIIDKLPKVKIKSSSQTFHPLMFQIEPDSFLTASLLATHNTMLGTRVYQSGHDTIRVAKYIFNIRNC
jgi:hypothetical protein